MTDYIAKLQDRHWRLNNLYWITDEQANRVLFRMNRVQERLYKSLWYLNIILKSRQHGITTFCCIYFLDACLFYPNVKAGIIADTKDDAEVFFSDKIKYAYENLPGQLVEARRGRTDSARELSFNNNSTIRVGVSMRGATLQYLHVSEFGKICATTPDKAREIVTGSLNTVHAGQFVTIESTAQGNEGYFFDFCNDAKKMQLQERPLSKLDYRFHFFAWWQDPRNQIEGGVGSSHALKDHFAELSVKHGIKLSESQKCWYEIKWKTQGADMKREHPSTPEEAFEASIEGAYFAPQFEKIYREKRITAVPYEPGIPVDTAWDLGMHDSTAIWFYQIHGATIRFIDFYENSGEGLAHYAEILRKRDYEYGTHNGPHDLEVRDLGTGKTRVETARDFGIYFTVAPKLDKQDQIEAARRILPLSWFDEDRCSPIDKRTQRRGGIGALEAYRKEWDEKRSTYRKKPLHNWASNAADAYQIVGVTYNPAVGGGRTFTPKRPRTARRVKQR